MIRALVLLGLLTACDSAPTEPRCVLKSVADWRATSGPSPSLTPMVWAYWCY